MFKKFITITSSLALSMMCITGCSQTTSNNSNEEELEDIYIDDDDEAFWNEVFGY